VTWLTGPELVSNYDVPSILGRPARSFEPFSADHAAAFA
jgi:hypothetical protein